MSPIATIDLARWYAGGAEADAVAAAHGAVEAGTPLGEIDIVARRGDTLAVIEVKARRDWQSASEAVGARQLGRLSRAAHVFLGANPQYAGLTLRFDVMLVTPYALPRHLMDAWRL